jgi:hypothetical protein
MSIDGVSRSPSSVVPSSTAMTGFTYAYVATVAVGSFRTAMT